MFPLAWEVDQAWVALGLVDQAWVLDVLGSLEVLVPQEGLYFLVDLVGLSFDTPHY